MWISNRSLCFLAFLPKYSVKESEDRQWHRAMEYVGAVSELSYLSQLVIMLYEDPTKDGNSDER